MSAGNELSEARERAGLTAHHVSERTKIQLYKIKALERDDYAQLPQGIYLDGIVRAYAHEVGIDPEPMVERVRLERGKLPGDWEVPFAAPISLHLAPARNKVPDPLEGFAAESDLKAEPVALYEYRATNATPAYQVPARPTRQRSGFVLPLLVLLAAAGLGMYFYRSTPALDRDVAETAANVETRPENVNDTPMADAAPRAPRPTGATVPKPSDMNSSVVARDTAGISDTAAAPARSVPSVAPTPAPRTQAADSAPGTSAPARPERIQTPGSSPDVTGSWRLATQVESSSYSSFAGLKLGYEMELEQDGVRVTGTGRKVTENGAGIVGHAQTPVTVSGTIDGDRLTLNFVERGARRPTQGKFVLMVDDAGTLRGRFSSNAARSSGRVEAHRVSEQ